MPPTPGNSSSACRKACRRRSRKRRAVCPGASASDWRSRARSCAMRRSDPRRSHRRARYRIRAPGAGGIESFDAAAHDPGNRPSAVDHRNTPTRCWCSIRAVGRAGHPCRAARAGWPYAHLHRMQIREASGRMSKAPPYGRRDAAALACALVVGTVCRASTCAWDVPPRLAAQRARRQTVLVVGNLIAGGSGKTPLRSR